MVEEGRERWEAMMAAAWSSSFIVDICSRGHTDTGGEYEAEGKRKVGTYRRNLKSDYPLQNVDPPRHTLTPCIQSIPLVLLGVYLLLCQSTYSK